MITSLKRSSGRFGTSTPGAAVSSPLDALLLLLFPEPCFRGWALLPVMLHEQDLEGARLVLYILAGGTWQATDDTLFVLKATYAARLHNSC
jgi:hypothetical protein